MANRRSARPVFLADWGGPDNPPSPSTPPTPSPTPPSPPHTPSLLAPTDLPVSAWAPSSRPLRSSPTRSRSPLSRRNRQNSPGHSFSSPTALVRSPPSPPPPSPLNRCPSPPPTLPSPAAPSSPKRSASPKRGRFGFFKGGKKEVEEKEEERENVIDSPKALDDLDHATLKKIHKSKISRSEFEGEGAKNFFILVNCLRFLQILPKNVRYSKSLNHGESLYHNNDEELDEKLGIRPLHKKLVTVGGTLGKGGFGSVSFAAVNQEIAKDISPRMKNCKKIAIKKMSHNTDKAKNYNYIEISFVSRLNHPVVVAYFDTFKEVNKNELWLMVEYLDGGNLHEAMKRTQFETSDVGFIAYRLLKGITYLHNMGFVHRDIKSRNIMLTTRGEVKLIDFGLGIEIKNREKLLSILGSSHYIAPEIIRLDECSHDFPADIWSFGVVMLELLNREEVTEKDPLSFMYRSATVGVLEHFKMAKGVDKMSREWVEGCLVLDKEKRAQGAELLETAFVKKRCKSEKFRKIVEMCFVGKMLDDFGLGL